MSYIKQQWKTGDVISAEKLNHIESGLEAVDKEQGPAGITPQLQNSGTAIQVSYNEGESYSDLVQLSEITGPRGPAGEGFAIYKTYASVTDMEADAANVEEGKFVMIASSEDDPDNAKLYVKSSDSFSFVSDLSGAQGIQGPQGEPGVQGPQGEPGKDGVTPVITVEATQLAYDQPISVVKSGTDAEPHFTFGIPAGQPGKDAELPDSLVTYSDFTYGDLQRKTIQLANYDSISGLGTDGTGYNIAMVSKWDKVDLGAAGLTMNLNSKDGQVQINDEKIIATVDQIPDISNLATKEELQTGLDSKQATGDYALKSELITPEQVVASEPMQDALNMVRSEIPTMEEIATSPEVSGLTQGLATEASVELALEGKQDKGNYALKSELPEVPEALPNPNALTIKYNGQVAFTYDGSKAETGNFVVNATTVPMSDSDNKTIAQALAEKQAVGDYALASDIPDVSGFATKIELTEGLAGKQAAGDYATNEIVEAEFASYDKTIKAYVDGKLTAVYTYKGSVATEEELPEEHTIGDVWNIESTGANVAWDGEKWDNLGATVDLSAYAKTADVEAELAKKQDAGDYATNESVETAIANIGVCNLGNFSSSGAAELKAAQVGTFDNPANKIFVYTVNNAQTGVIINNITGEQQATQFINWNGAASKRTVTADSASSWVQTDVNFLANKGIMLTKLRQLTTESDSEAVKAALTGGAGQQAITASDLDTCFTKDLTIREYSMQFAGFKVGYTGSDYVLTYVGVPNPAASPVICNVRIAITNEGVYSCVTNPVYGTIATTADLQEKADKIHTHEIADVEGLQDTLDAKTIAIGHVGLNEDTVEIKQGESVVAQLTVPYYPLKVNASLFIDDGSFYDPEGGLGGHPDYFDNVKWSGGDNLTEEQLAKGPFLLITGTNTTDEEGTKILTNLVSLGKDSALGKVYATKKELETKADADHTHYTLPVRVSLPDNFQDKVYTEAEICGWFGVQDVTELKGLLAQPHQFVISKIISSGSIGYHNYQIPFQYVYVDKTSKSLKAIAIGLNTLNDTVSKIVLEANFDGTVIEGASNVKISYASLE